LWHISEIIIGHSPGGRLLVVAFKEVKKDRLRIISAREVTRSERSCHEK
jgi:uncharacterized DUF497 family protein